MSDSASPTPDRPSDREVLIRLDHVTKRFGRQTVLDDVCLDIYRDERLVIIGGSGSGKSTLLNLMIGELRPDSGQVIVGGRNICALNEREIDEYRRMIGVSFQSGALFNSMTVAENVALPLREHTTLASDIIDIQVKIKLELVGLREHADKFPSQLSGGMKKRAGLARALALDPQILFYDEPSAGLDPVTSAEIDQLIIDLTRKLGVTSVVVTHEMDSAFTIADRMAMLDKGRMLMVGTREEFDQLRHLSEEEVSPLSERDQIIRQFLRGDPKGPITARRAATNYADDLLGTEPARPGAIPAIQATRNR